MTDALNRSHQQLDTRTRDLERSNHDLEQYAQMASHDLQAPLATIDLYLRLIERRLPDASQEELVQLLEGVGGSTDRMRSLVRDLLHLARVGRGEPRRETLDTRAVLDRALENLAGPIEERGADVSAGPLPIVSGDPGQLSLLFQNLLGNAIKFSDHDAPHVSVTASIEGAEAQFAVRDNGIGIDPQHAERIFQPFQRLHGEDRYEGTGIGLAICQRIVSHHGGRIWAESTVGGGSTFRFTLPLADASPPPPGRRPRTRPRPRTQRPHEGATRHAAGARRPRLLALAGCGGGGDDPPTGPSQSRGPIRLGTKNFTEQYILGEIYAQSLRAHGIPVELKSDIGSSEIVDQAMQIGSLDMYPEYTGVLLSEIAGVSGGRRRRRRRSTPPRSSSARAATTS